jgi:hypothetical protein
VTGNLAHRVSIGHTESWRRSRDCCVTFRANTRSPGLHRARHSARFGDPSGREQGAGSREQAIAESPIDRIEHATSVRVLHESLPQRQCVLLIAHIPTLWQAIVAEQLAVEGHAEFWQSLVLDTLACWDAILLLGSAPAHFSSFAPIVATPLAARLGMAHLRGDSVERWRCEIMRLRTVAMELPCPRHPYADALLRALPSMPSAWRPTILRAIRSPAEWTVKRVCFACETRRRTLERWCRKVGLPSPADLFGGNVA